MKIIKTVIALAFFLALPQAYADGGSQSNATYKCRATLPCPSGESGSVSLYMEVQYYDRLKCPLATKKAEEYLNSGWSDNKVANWLKKYFAWGKSTVTRNCVNSGPAYVSTTTEYRSVSCPEGQTGAIQQKRTYDVWTDDSTKNISGWSDASNTCAVVPTQDTEIKDGMEEVSCDSYYGAVTGSYTGSVYNYGEYVSSYNSGSMNTNTVFNIKSVDATSCTATISDLSIEYKAGICEPGETGSKNYYRYKAINSKSEVTYPYGDWEILDNTCAAQGAVENATPVAPEKVTGLLGNMHFTSLRLMSDDSFSTYLNNLAADGWTGKERHKLTINIDDLSNGSYDAKKISSIISKFQSVVGAGNTDVKIVLPRSIDKLVGNGNITAKASASKTLVLKNIRLVGTNAVVNYVELTSGKAVGAPTAKETKIQVLSSDVDLTKISSE